MFSEDVDFLVITAAWLTTGREFGGVIYASQVGITIGPAIGDLELFAKILEPDDMKNNLERIPLK